MIDIHCHILPDVDDGARTMEEAIEMARAAVEDGIQTVVATPHHYNGHYINERQEIQAAVSTLRAELAERSIPLQVLCGQEIRLYERMLDDYDSSKLQLLHDSDYLLVEFPSHGIPSFADEIFHELHLLGKIPIIAHPERNKAIAEDPDKLLAFISNGALAQVTSHSVSGGLGRKLQQQSLELCRRNLIHFVSSDAHNNRNRPFMLSEAYRIIREQASPDMEAYLVDNAECIVSNRLLDKREPLRAKRKWFSFW